MNSTTPQKITVPGILSYKSKRKPIVALTAYDYWLAHILDGKVDIILVGDSLSSVIQGRENTLPVTLEQMIYHSQCVTRAVKYSLVVADLPFLSYQPSIERVIDSAGRLLKESGVAAVKLEGGMAVASRIQSLSDFDIPVMGHVGLTPQSYHRMGGHKRQGVLDSPTDKSSAGSRQRIIEDAIAVAEAGAFALVIEGVPADLAAEISSKVSIPTIGIGAGKECDGQILVTHDMLGTSDSAAPSFVKQYANLHQVIQLAVQQYAQEVKNTRDS